MANEEDVVALFQRYMDGNDSIGHTVRIFNCNLW